MAGPGVSSLYILRTGACWREHIEDRPQILSRAKRILRRLTPLLSRTSLRSPRSSTTNTLTKPAARDPRRCSAPRKQTTKEHQLCPDDEGSMHKDSESIQRQIHQHWCDRIAVNGKEESKINVKNEKHKMTLQGTSNYKLDAWHDNLFV